MSTMKTQDGVQIEVHNECLDCKTFHRESVPPGNGMVRLMDEWQNKHLGHKVQSFVRSSVPRDFDDSYYEKIGKAPWWLDHPDFKPNANIKTAYASSVNLTITLASLATDANLLVGRASTAIDETSNLYLDECLAGFISNGTSPTVSKEIDVWAYATADDGPTYPSGGTSGGTRISGTDAGFTFATVNQYFTGLRLVTSMTNSATTAETNNFGPISLTSLFGGIIPAKWGVWVVHNTAVNLNATGGNHQITAKPVYATSV